MMLLPELIHSFSRFVRGKKIFATSFGPISQFDTAGGGEAESDEIQCGASEGC